MLNLFKKKHDDPKKVLQEILRDYQLPSFPTTVIGVLRMLRDAATPLPAVAAALAKDPGLNVRVLRTVNSAAFGLARNVSNVQRAVTMLGRSRVEALVVSAAVKAALPRADSQTFDSNHFWLTAARRASLARLLARHLEPSLETEAFTAGLLQDMAVPVLAVSHQERYGAVYEQYRANPNAHLHVLERTTLGYDHATVGALIAETWNLPAFLSNAIAGHHTGEGSVTIRLVSHLRDSTRDDGVEAVQAACEAAGLQPALVQGLIDQAFADAKAFHQQAA